MHTGMAPSATVFTSAPLRNRLRIQLDAPPESVWSLIGGLTRYPEYSAGLDRVEMTLGSTGLLTEYVCYFKPQQDGGERVAHRERIQWDEPNRGYASSAEEPNTFGLTNALTLVVLEPSNAGAVMTWEQYYDAADLDMSRAVFDEALADIGERLVARFGGRVAERRVEGQRQRASAKLSHGLGRCVQSTRGGSMMIQPRVWRRHQPCV